MTLKQQEDVDIPPCLRFQVGGLLRTFSEQLSADGFLVEQTPKPPGNHVTSWWLYVTIDAIIPLIHRGGVSAHAVTLEGVKMNEWDSELWNIADWTRAE